MLLVKKSDSNESIFRIVYTVFCRPRESTEDDQVDLSLNCFNPRKQWPQINEIVRGDRRMSVRMIVETVAKASS